MSSNKLFVERMSLTCWSNNAILYHFPLDVGNSSVTCLTCVIDSDDFALCAFFTFLKHLKSARTYFPFDICACAVTLQARPLANARAHSRTQCTKLLSSSHLTSPCTFSIDRREQQCDEPINGRCQWQPFASPQVPSLDLPQRV